MTSQGFRQTAKVVELSPNWNVVVKMAITIDRELPSCAGTSDEDLLLDYRSSGERCLFAELVRRYERELYNYLRRYLGDAEMAEDVFQVTFLLVHLKCRQFERGRRFRPWLYAIATNAAIDAQRRDKRHRAVSLDRFGAGAGLVNGDASRLADLLVSDDPDPAFQASRLERGQWVRRALDDLSEQMRSVVNLVYYQGLKYREAAEVLNIPVGTVKSRLHAAIQKLNEHWHNTHTD
jgi:RNA polymerase sigma-70 factor (ECF subfamily)